MKEYLDKSILIEDFKLSGADKELIEAIVYRINLHRPADVAPVVHGKWIGKKYNWDNDYNPPEVKDSHYLVCSNCDHRHPLYNYSVWTNTLTRCTVFTDPITIPNYCPKCGAKIEED